MTDTQNPSLVGMDHAYADAGIPIPDYLEDLMRERNLKVHFWRLDEPFALDSEDPRSELIANLTVIFENGRRPFRSDILLELNTAYGLVGTADITPETAEHAIDQITEKAAEINGNTLVFYAEDESFAQAVSDWELSDADLVRAAAPYAEGEWGTLLLALAPIVDSFNPQLSLAAPEAQVAALAVKIAWDLL